MLRAFVYASIALVAVGCSGSRQDEVDPLPAADDVKIVEVIAYRKSGMEDPVAFTMQPEDWSAVRAGLLPASRYRWPMKWQMLATLEITKTDGEPFHVSLYAPQSEPGAFSAGRTQDERVYY